MPFENNNQDPKSIAKSLILAGQFSLLKDLDISIDSLKAVLIQRPVVNSLMLMNDGKVFIEYLEFEISPTLKTKDLLKMGDFANFYNLASENGHVDVLNYLRGLRDFRELHVVTRCDYRSGVLTANHRRVSHVESSCYYSPYRLAAKNGHEAVLKHLESIPGFNALEAATVKDHYFDNQYENNIAYLSAYQCASENGHINILNHLEGIKGFNALKAAKAHDYDAYRRAAKNGHDAVLIHIEGLKNGLFGRFYALKIEKKGNYKIYCSASENGHVNILKHLEDIKGFNALKAAQAKNYSAYRIAAENGHEAVLIHIEAITGFNALEVTKQDNYRLYRLAAKNGHVNILKHLEGIKGFNALKAAKSSKEKNYSAYRIATEYGHINILNHLEGIKGFDALKAATAEDYNAYRLAAKNGHIDILNYLKAINGFNALEAAKADDYSAYRLAAKNGHIDILNYLESIPNFHVLNARMSACRHSLRNYKERAIDYILQFNDVFSYAEENWYGMDSEINEHVSSRLLALKKEKDLYEENAPGGVFDIAKEESIHAFYMLRNLIRRGVRRNRSRRPNPIPSFNNRYLEAEDLSDEIDFLLTIPSVKALCHQAITVDAERPGCENELLRFAKRIENSGAYITLIQIRDVWELAFEADFYQENLNLIETVQNTESSMEELNELEEKSLEKARSYYQDKIDERGGSDAVLKSLKEELKRRYKQNPAAIKIPIAQNEGDGTGFGNIFLPFDWEELQVLRTGLTESQYQAALKTYYKDKTHTAYRCLSKPNKWMHSDASYVYVSDDRLERWSGFENYQSLIALLFTAAFDDATPAIDGHTLESRKDMFIDQLASIGRAHNWDEIDEKGQEYDDSEADKPSCSPGFKKRLLQSVLGHGLFKVVTKEILIKALDSKITAYFNKAITLTNCVALKKAYDGMVMFEGDKNEHVTTLKRLDIPVQEKEAMIDTVTQQLSGEYGCGFDEQKDDFKKIMKQYLNVSDIEGCDFIQFQGRCSLDALLAQKVKTRNLVERTIIEQCRHTFWHRKDSIEIQQDPLSVNFFEKK
jgi:hypothetical protein